MKKIVPYLVSALVICALYYWQTKQELIDLKKQTIQDTLIVGISPDYPPYAQIDIESGAIIGLEVDVINEVAKRLHKKLIIKDMPFNSLIIELMAGQIDVVAAGLCPSEERKKNILFSHPYIENDDNVVVNKTTNPAITNIQDLYGKHVAVNIGYTADTFLSTYPEIHLVRLKTPSDAFMALQSNSVDAFAIAQSTFNDFIHSQENSAQYQLFKLPGSADACALAYAKKNTALQDEIDPVIDEMIEDGTMKAIQKKWGFA